MTENAPNNAATLEQRQAIFHALLDAQDAGASVPQSRTNVAAQFSVTVEEVKKIEKEGLDGQWPPL